MKKYAIGIDIGGTKISMVLGTSSGKVLACREIPTQTGANTKSCIKELVSNLYGLVQTAGIPKKKILGIGVGIPGAVNARKGLVPRSPNLPGWNNLPLVKVLSKATGLPVRLGNDANAAALGESLFGAGKNSRNFIYITVSTGIGGGIIIDGKLYEGSGFVAGEIGHMSIVPEGRKCNCGQKGCLEAYASGTAIGNFVRERMTRNNTTIWKFLPGDKRFNARQVGMAAREGDKLSIEAYRQAGYYFGIGIANLLNIINPEKVVIGGGVLKSAHKIFWETMIKSTKQHAWPEAFRTVKIVRSQLKGHVGDFGALALVFKNQ
ncbi:MAG: ROK family protein [Candidatus Omnitrophota bacterium]